MRSDHGLKTRSRFWLKTWRWPWHIDPCLQKQHRSLSFKVFPSPSHSIPVNTCVPKHFLSLNIYIFPITSLSHTTSCLSLSIYIFLIKCRNKRDCQSCVYHDTPLGLLDLQQLNAPRNKLHDTPRMILWPHHNRQILLINAILQVRYDIWTKHNVTLHKQKPTNPQFKHKRKQKLKYFRLSFLSGDHVNYCRLYAIH